MGALESLGHSEISSVIVGYRDALRAHQDYLNRLNVYPVPDGDTGTNMALTLEAVVADLEGAGDLSATCKAIRQGSLMGARGNSGVILSQVLRGLAASLHEAGRVDARTLAQALDNASAAAYEAVARPVEGTILTVARDAAQAAIDRQDGTLVEMLEAAAEAARASLARTPDLLPVLAEAGVVDAGAAGFCLLLDALLEVVDGRPVPAPEPGVTPAAVTPALPSVSSTKSESHTAVGDLRYEVMFFLEAADEAVTGFKTAWTEVGDSIVVVGGDGLWNCHIHTDDIGAAIEAAVDAGRPRQIRVTDLHEQSEEVAAAHAAAVKAPATTAAVAVGDGEGVAHLLRSLGVAAVVPGGRSLNPSTAELLDAVERVPARAVVLLPNHRNIVPAAEKVSELASRPVRVVATRSVPEGLAALMAFDADVDVEGNTAAMRDAIAGVTWGEVTRAVRPAKSAVGPIREGNWLGLAADDIVVVADDLAEAARQLLEKLVGADHELVTVLEGDSATPAATETIVDWVTQNRPGATAEVHPGGQPLSAYLFSVE